MAEPRTQSGRVYDMADQFKRELALGQDAAQERILRSWAVAYDRTRVEYQAILDRITEAHAKGEPVRGWWLYERERLARAEAVARTEMGRYGLEAAGVTQDAQEVAVRSSVRQHGAMVDEVASQAGLSGSFVQPNPDAVRHLSGFLADGSPLSTLLGSLGDQVATLAHDALVEGLALGKHPNWMAQRLSEAMDFPRHRAVTIMRTETQRVYREAARETYQANPTLVGSWVWTATLTTRTCSACLVMHGTVHPISETLDGHPRCRCAMVPRTPSWADLGVGDLPDTRPPIPDGKAWLAEQSPATQRAILGTRRWQAWKSGEVSLDDMVARTHSADWGTMRRERSLVEIREGRNANTLPGPIRKPAPAKVAPAKPADPYQGVSDADLVKRLSNGDMTSRRAAQTELMRRADERADAAKALALKELEQHAGDGKAWTAVPDRPVPTYQRGLHRVTVEPGVNMGDALAPFLDDVATVLDRAGDLGRPLTFRVPANDPVFRGRMNGLTAGYVTEGLDFVNINPLVARGLAEDMAEHARHDGQFMPGAKDTTMRRWTLAHELGHAFDHGHDHTHDGKAAGAAWRKAKPGLSRYGKSSRHEGYAEAWAQWLIGGPGSNPVADAYAREYGWPGLK